MGHTRVAEPRSGATVWINGARQDRPNLPPSRCPFCPGGVEAPDDYDVRWFPNRWPALPDDRCEVILYTSRHDAAFWELGVAGARRVIDLWALRTAELGARPDVVCVLPFENRGAEVGATISHPHGQLYALDEVPPVLRSELAGDGCPICSALQMGCPVSEAGGWRVVVPAAARYPFELLIGPVDHRPDLPSLVDDERDAMATVLVDALARLDRLFDSPMPYMLWVHQRPTDGGDWPLAHIHVEVAPLYRAPGTPRYVAAAELATGVWLNPVEPSEAARRLRELAV
jgi:UDPglucose--hexose-1-phosphate uridylyltransferase